MTSRVLNRRQGHWSLFLTDFDFEITYRSGCFQGRADALSRHPNYLPSLQETVLLNPNRLNLQLNATYSMPLDTSLLFDIQEASKDLFTTAIISKIKSRNLSIDEQETVKRFVFDQERGMLLYNNLIYVPDGPTRLTILWECHASKLAGHFGSNKTQELMLRNDWWPQQWGFVRNYNKSCDIYGRSKSSRPQPFRLLHSLPVPLRP
jgi:hypothetical protein